MIIISKIRMVTNNYFFLSKKMQSIRNINDVIDKIMIKHFTFTIGRLRHAMKKSSSEEDISILFLLHGKQNSLSSGQVEEQSIHV